MAFSARIALRNLLRPILPTRVRDRMRIWETRMRFGSMSRANAFSTTYSEGVWGRRDEKPFFSGEGSSGEFADKYCELIQTYIRENDITSIVDLGCGDFTIGGRLAASVPSYCGIDIVPELIEYNAKTFGNERIAFECVDIVEGALPPAQLCLVRQVLQHLSNAEIQTALKRLSIYPHVIVTEHVPVGRVAAPNKDKAHGPDQRIYDDSGVFLSEPPFSCTIAKTWELPYREKERFLLVLMRNATARQK